jgi:AcrR family transcriptional regulator
MGDDMRVPTELPMLSERPERADAAANRVRILAAARMLLAEHGPNGVSMEAVAVAAGVGKGTVFRRFGDRVGLMEALVNDYMRSFQDAFLSGPPPLGPGADPSERLETFFVELVRLQRANLPLALAAASASGPRRDGAFGALLLHVRTLVQSVDAAIDADVTAAMLLGAVAPGVLDRLPDGHDGLDGIISSTRALLTGVLTPVRPLPDGAPTAG